MSIFLLFWFFFPLPFLRQNYFCTNESGSNWRLQCGERRPARPAPGDIFQKPPPTAQSSRLSLMNADPSSSPPFKNRKPEDQNKESKTKIKPLTSYFKRRRMSIKVSWDHGHEWVAIHRCITHLAGFPPRAIFSPLNFLPSVAALEKPGSRRSLLC